MENPINYERLDREAPDWKKLELSYTPEDERMESGVTLGERNLIYLELGALLAAVSVFLISLDLGFWIVSASIVLGSVFAFGMFLRVIFGNPVSGGHKAAIIVLLIGLTVGPLLYFLGSVVKNAGPRIALTSLSVIGMFWIGRGVVRHYFYWVLASPRLRPEEAEKRREWFQGSRKIREELRELKQRRKTEKDSAALDLINRQIREIRSFKGNWRMWLVVFSSYLLLPHLPWPLWSGMLTLLLPAAVCLFHAWKTGPDVERTIESTWKAIICWMGIGPVLERVPGVFQSPVLLWWRRILFTSLCLVTLAIAVLPSVHFFSCGFDFMQAIDPNLENHPSVLESLDSGPASWVSFALDLAWRSGQFQYWISLCFAVLAGIFFPTLALFNVIVVSGGTSLAWAYEAIKSERAYALDPHATDWETYVNRLQTSAIEREKEHLWLGTHAVHDYPILLDREILKEHTYIVGDSGSGKTALGISPLMSQLIRMGDDAVVIIDLKGDNALFQTAKAEAKKSGRTFKFFTNERGKATHTFNPLLKKNISHLTLSQVCETMLESLNLNHGDGYGRSYYSRVSRHWLRAALEKNPDVESFEQLYHFISKDEFFDDPKDRNDAFELIAVIESLASYEALNFTADKNPEILDHGIHMPELIENREIAYFWLPAAAETATVRELAKLALYSLLSSAYSHSRLVSEGKAAKRQTYLFLDEFQRIASENLKIVLEQARSMGVGAILANQTFADLKTPSTDLRPVIQGNTRLKLCFSATDLEQQDTLMKASGETMTFNSVSLSSGDSNTTSWTAQIGPRLTRNFIIEVSDDPLSAIGQISRGSGYSQFWGYSFPFKAYFAVTKKVYEEIQATPWPVESEHTFVPHKRPLEPEYWGSLQNRLRVSEELDQSPQKPKLSPTAQKYSARIEQLRQHIQNEYRVE